MKSSQAKDNFAKLLILGTLLINLFVWGLLGYSLYNSRKHYDKLAEITTQNMAKTLEANITGIFDKIDVGVSAVVREVERELAAGGIKQNELDPYIQKQVRQLPEVDGLRVSDAQGNLQFGSNIHVGNLSNISDRNYFKKLRDNPDIETATSRLIQGKISGKWNISIARRINNPDGSFAGVAIGTFAVEYCDTLFSHLDIGEHGAVGIRDQEFKLVALYPKSKEPGSQIGSGVVSKKTVAMIKANPVTATYKTIFARDGKERMTTFRKAAKYPLYIFANVAPSDYLASWRKEVATSVVLLSCFMMATIIAGRMIIKSRAEEVLHAEARQRSEQMRQENVELNSALSKITRLSEERDKAEMALRESEELFRNILENAPIGMTVVSLEGRFVLVNQALCEITGFEKEELEKLTFQEITYPEDLDSDLAKVQQLLDGTLSSYQMEKRYIRKDGKTVWIQLTASIKRHSNGMPQYFIAQIEDISQRKQYEAELREARDTANAANLAKSTFLANMSHEIRTPLNGIVGMIELLKFTDLALEQQEYLQIVSQSSDNLLSIINDILDLSKIEAGKVELDYTDFSLKRCISDTFNMVVSQIQAKSLSYQINFDDAIPNIVNGDQLRIKQVLLNLLSNAVKFTEQGGITLTAAIKESYDHAVLVDIAVDDSGVGISESVIDKIFSPFVQADSSTARNYGGTGLGLAICRQLAELMGGSVSVESREGIGSTFHLTMPFNIPTVRPMAFPSLIDQDINPDIKPLRILLVEDNKANEMFARSLLTKIGHTVFSTESGMTAIELWEKGDFDLILMDIQMPKIGGDKAVAIIRDKEKETGCHIPIIAVTARALKEDKEYFLTNGFDGYVPKPFKREMLQAEMTRVCSFDGANRNN